MENVKNTKKLREIAEKYNLKLLLLFGSRAGSKKFLHKESDFDVAYLPKKDLDLTEEAKLICDLMPVFRSERIDLVNLKKALPLLFYAVFQNCQILYADNPLLFYYLRSYAFKKYIETKPLYQERAEKINILIKNL
ncbi:MAG: nucleotidyltransferase domain-containing protein [Xanthomonadaceae bacterium]|nr:nucleotidyltransferase domain-containing protein [Rhodospirillaceae bacterium]NIA17634.1 nucleotidyltransferase domain-containing protein [Xanthomonadaceae bacterium]